MAEIRYVRGLIELEANLAALGSEMRERGVKRMMSMSAVPMRDEARRRAPILQEPNPRRRAGTLRDAIVIWRKRQTPYAATYYVGVRGLSSIKISAFKKGTGKASTDNPNDPFYWRFVELGTSKMPPRPFLRGAFESRKHDAVTAAIVEAKAFIQRTVRKFLKIKARVSP